MFDMINILSAGGPKPDFRMSAFVGYNTMIGFLTTCITAPSGYHYVESYLYHGDEINRHGFIVTDFPSTGVCRLGRVTSP